MSTYEENGSLQKIDITKLTEQVWNTFKKIWYVFLVLPVLFAGLNFFRVANTFTPVYTAEATVSVSVAGLDENSSNNSATASQLGEVFPYILTSSALKDIIASDLGMSYVPGNITVTNLKDTNFLTIRVTGTNPEYTYNVLQSVIKNYPEVAQHVVGKTNIEIIDDSGIPMTTGKSAALKKSLLTGALFGLMAAVLVLVIASMTFTTVLTSKDLRSVTNVTYLGTLPVYRKKKRRHSESGGGISILKSGVQKDYLEAVRVIRTRLDRKIKKSGTVLMVTSSLPGEGKSTVAVNLALAFAMQEKRVVLIDCDLRNPSVQSVLGFKGEYPGLTKYLQGECSLDDTLLSYGNRKLKLVVIPGSDPEKEDHPELLRTEKMRQLMEQLRRAADLIILDTPPSAMLADAEMVTDYSDLAVYVVMCDYARKSYIQRGIRELSETGIEIGGVILNGGRQSSSGGYSSYGKGSYYGQEAAQ